MTLLVLNTEEMHAEVMVDSVAYNPDGRHVEFATGSKVLALDRIDAATVTRGDVTLGEVWDRMAAKLDEDVADYDEFTDNTPAALHKTVELVHEFVRMAGKLPPGEAHTFHAYTTGYSPRAGRFQSHVFCSDDGFEPIDITDEVHVTPAPPGIQPTEIEAHRWAQLADVFAAAGMNAVTLPDGEPATAPTTDAEWVALAERIFRGRALATPASGMKVLVGGDITLTRLEVGEVTQRTIHTFTNEDHATMIASLRLQPSTKAGRNDPCPCGSGAKFKKCCALVGAGA